MKKITVPQLNSNDNNCTISQIHINTGEWVEKQAELVTVETSKSFVEIESEGTGYFYPVVKEDDELNTGELIACIFETMEDLKEYQANQSSKKELNSFQNYKLSKKASEFMETHNFTDEELTSLGKKVIKVSDLEQLLNSKSDSSREIIEFSKNQKHVAKTVSLSKNTIPAAYLVMKINMNSALKMMENLSNKNDSIIGISDVLPVIVAQLKEAFPFFYGTLEDDSTFVLSEAVEIGITIDVGSGLFIPILKKQQLQSVQDVSEALSEYRYKALRNEFKDEDLSGGTISISLNTVKDVVTVIPIIIPGQIAMVSVGGMMKEVIQTEKGISENNYFHLGISYDHRVVNGVYAMEFVSALKEKLEKADF